MIKSEKVLLWYTPLQKFEYTTKQRAVESAPLYFEEKVAGSLEVAPGVQVIDTMNVPDQIKGRVLATSETFYILREGKELEWTFLCPPSTISPEERTGHYRVGKNQLLKNEAGESQISTQDYAVAMLDELVHPQHIRERFTVGH